MAGRRGHKYGKAECGRCGFVYPLRCLTYEWSNLKVCATCWDPFPTLDFPRKLEAESQALWDARPSNDIPASTGHAIGVYQIIGRSWNGTDLNMSTGEVIGV